MWHRLPQRHLHTHVFAALFTIDKYGNSQDASLLTTGSRKLIHNGILLSHEEE
jgi:hypothetical protein